MILKLMLIFLLSANPNSKQNEGYEYFPKYWPIINELKKIDSLIFGNLYKPLKEKPLFKIKRHNAYRIIGNSGVLVIEQKKNDVCNIRLHKRNPKSILDKTLPEYITYQVNQVKNCEKEADLKTVSDLVKGIELSLPRNFFKDDGFMPGSTNFIEAYSTEEGHEAYKLKISWNIDEIHKIDDYYTKIVKLFKKKGVLVVL